MVENALYEGIESQADQPVKFSSGRAALRKPSSSIINPF